MKKFLVVFCFVSILTSCNKDKLIEGDLTVSGYLTNGENPVANAIIDIDDLAQYQVTSNKEGFFEIKNVAKGAHKLNYKVGPDEGSFSKITERIEVNDDLLLESLMLPDPVTLYDPEIQGGLESNQVSLSWDKYTGTDFREYKLYKHSSSGLDETTGELLHVATSANDTVFTTTLPYSSVTYFRVFVLDDFGLLGGSNIIEVPIGVYTLNPEITLGVQTDYFLNLEEEHELYFDVPQQGIYAITWFDNWSDNYSINSIVVSAYNEDKSNYYFQNERLIADTGSPRPIYVSSAQRVYLNVKGFQDRFSGTYGVKITPLGDDVSTPLTIGLSSNIIMDQGDIKISHFEALANTNYQITAGNTVSGIPYDNGRVTHISIYEENASSFSIYKELIPMPCCGGTETYTVSVDTAKKVYIIIDGSFYSNRNTVNLQIEEL